MDEFTPVLFVGYMFFVMVMTLCEYILWPVIIGIMLIQRKLSDRVWIPATILIWLIVLDLGYLWKHSNSILWVLLVIFTGGLTGVLLIPSKEPSTEKEESKAVVGQYRAFKSVGLILITSAVYALFIGYCLRYDYPFTWLVEAAFGSD